MELLLEKKKAKPKMSEKIKKEFRRNKYLYLMALPVIAYYLLFHYGPMYGAVIAFKQYNIADGIWGSKWVGFKYFKQFFDSYYFWRLIRNTLTLSLKQLIWGFPAPIVLALLLNEVRNKRFKKTVQSITYLPHFVSLVVITGMIRDFVARDGIVTDVLVFFGMERVNLLSVPEFFSNIYVASGIWQGIGWGTIIYLAALSGVDAQLYEAASIDGAGRLKSLIHITLPSILPTIIILLILNIGKLMSIGFEKVILLYNPTIYETADIISSFVYRKGLGDSFEFSYTTAIGLFRSVINFVLLVTANQLSKKTNETSLW